MDDGVVVGAQPNEFLIGIFETPVVLSGQRHDMVSLRYALELAADVTCLPLTRREQLPRCHDPRLAIQPRTLPPSLDQLMTLVKSLEIIVTTHS